MNKTRKAILLVITVLVGSFVTFYASNMVFSDIANACMGLHDIYFIASLPAFIFAFDFIVLAVYLIRLVIKPYLKYRLTRFYYTVFFVLSILGVITSLLTGFVVYGSFNAPYPFPGYTMLALSLHVIILTVSIIIRISADLHVAEENATEKAKSDRGVIPVYVIYTILFVLVTFFAFNRLGAFLWSPVYVQMRTLYMTWPFYLWLLIPIAFLSCAAAYMFGAFNRHKKAGLVNVLILLIFNIALGGSCIVIGRSSTLFTAAVSPALAFERLATMPIDTIIQFAGTAFLSIYMLIFAIRFLKKDVTPFDD